MSVSVAKASKRKVSKDNTDEEAVKEKRSRDVDPEIKNCFYQLSSVNEAERKAAITLLSDINLTPEQEEYVINRLTAGCAAGGRGARLTYPTVLAVRLNKSPKKFSIVELVEIANKKLPIQKKSESSNEIIGQQLFYTAVINSMKFKKAVDLLEIAKILHEHYQKYDQIRFAVAMSLVDIAKIVGEHYFSPHFIPVNLLPTSLQTLDNLKPEQFFILLRLREVLIKHKYSCAKFFKNGKFLFKPEYFPEIQRLLRQTVCRQDGFLLLNEVYNAALDNGVSMNVINEVFYPAFKFDINDKINSKDENYLVFIKVVNYWLDRKVLSLDDCKAIFSNSTFLKRIGCLFEFVEAYNVADNKVVHRLIDSLVKYLKAQDNVDLVDFIVTVHDVEEDAAIDKFFEKSGITKKLFGLLSDDSMKRLIEKMLENPLDFIVNEFFEALPAKHPQFTIEHRIDFIQKSATPSSSMLHETLKQLFVKPHRESHGIAVTQEAEKLFSLFVKKYAEKDLSKIKEKDNEMKNKLMALRNVSSLFYVLHALTVDEDETGFYGKIAESLETMIKEKEVDVEEVFDRIIEIVARKGKASRLSAFYLATVFSPYCKQEQLVKLAETIKKSNWAIVTGDEEEGEDDDEFAPITAEELASINQNANDEESDDEESDDDDEESAEEDDDNESYKELILQKPNLIPEGREPHPQMVSALRRALGRYAATEDDNVDDDIEMDDEELAVIDERLSNVMKAFTTKGRKAMIQEAKLYRNRLAEIFSLSLEFAAIKEILAFLPKLFEIMEEADGKGREEVISAIVVVTQVLSHRSGDEKTISKTALTLFKKLCEVTEKMHNILMKTAITHLTIFLFKSVRDASAQKTLHKFFVQEVEKYFKEGNRSSKYTVLYAIVKRYHNIFVTSIGLFFDLFINTKESKKGEAANIVAVFNRKDVISAHQELFQETSKQILDHFKPKSGKIKDDVISSAMKVFLSETALDRLRS